ncbi:helix-turn-helix domain-containing protein [Xanthobacter pseudotagetidis]|uniref:helix-turn-helix domain-containing protein n=1 Tax=Xanthobacter pseudotagetidis TaxID=3119911 RepID=UPI00372725D6
MTPAQCRAARALLDLTQPALAQAASLGLSTVVDFERSRRAVSGEAIGAIRTALEAAGVEFIAENGGGAGVRLRQATPRLEAVAFSSFHGRINLRISYCGSIFETVIPSTILEDIDHANYRNDSQLKESFGRHMNLILVRAATAIDSGRAQKDGSLRLKPDDFPEAS